MPDKTTLYLDEAEYRRLKALARTDGRPAAALIRDAVAQYLLARTQTTRPASIGVGRSGRGDIADRAEQLLAGMGRKR